MSPGLTALREREFGPIRAILAGDARDQGFLHSAEYTGGSRPGRRFMLAGRWVSALRH